MPSEWSQRTTHAAGGAVAAYVGCHGRRRGNGKRGNLDWEAQPIFDYKNNCAVVVEPIQFIDGSSIAIYRDGSSIEDASGVALATCAQRNGRECKVNYSNCTRPVLVN